MPTDSATATRTPPHDLAAERALLSAAMHSRDALDVLARTPIDAFYSPLHKHTAEVLGLALEHGWRPDTVQVLDQLERMGVLDDVGGAAAIFDLAADAPATASAPRYSQIIERHWRARRWAMIGVQLTDYAYQGLEDSILASILPAVDALTSAAGKDGPIYADLAQALADYGDDPGPDQLARVDGQFLLYAGAVNYMHGEPGKGKSWVAFHAGAALLADPNYAGARVAILDFEDAARPVARRLVALGASGHDIAERVYYVNDPHDRPMRELVRLAVDVAPTLIIVDGVAASMTAANLDEDKSSDVNRWFDTLARPLAACGAAVICVDHVTKSRETRGLWPRGSGAKRARIDGAAYAVEHVEGQMFTRTKAGFVRLRLAKDRRGFIGAEGDLAGVFHVEPDPSTHSVRVRIEPPRLSDELAEVDDKKPGPRADVCDAIVAALAAMPDTEIPPTRDRLLDVVRALGPKLSPSTLGASCEWLAQRGRIVRTQKGRRAGWALPTEPPLPVPDQRLSEEF